MYPSRESTLNGEDLLVNGDYPSRVGVRMTPDQFFAAQRQRIKIRKYATRTSVAASPTSLFDVAGNPGAGTLGGSSTSAGVVPTDATNGFPPIRAFPAGARGVITRVDAWSNVIATISLFDMLWKGGAYAFNANTTLSAQPSFESRVPDGDYDTAGLEIWFEAVTAFTGNITLNVTYTSGPGTTGRTAGARAYGVAPIVGSMFRVPFQLGDAGVRKIESVVATVSSAGTFNILVLRRLWWARVGVAQTVTPDPMFRERPGVCSDDNCRLPQVFDSSALFAMSTPDSTTSGPFELDATIAAI